jgi:hypothetical protein
VPYAREADARLADVFRSVSCSMSSSQMLAAREVRHGNEAPPKGGAGEQADVADGT